MQTLENSPLANQNTEHSANQNLVNNKEYKLTNIDLESGEVVNQNLTNNNLTNQVAGIEELTNRIQKETVIDNEPMDTVHTEKREDFMNSSRDTQTLDDTGGDIDIEPYVPIRKVGHNREISHSDHPNMEEAEENTQNVENTNIIIFGENKRGEVLGQTAFINYLNVDLKRDPESELNAISIHSQNVDNISSQTSDNYQIVDQDMYGNDAWSLDNDFGNHNELSFKYANDVGNGRLADQSFALASDIPGGEIKIPAKKTVKFADYYRNVTKSDTISDIETPRSFLDDEKKFHDVFVNSYDQSEPFLEPAVSEIQSEQTLHGTTDQNTYPGQSDTLVLSPEEVKPIRTAGISNIVQQRITGSAETWNS